jgi:hypothetical protein
MPGVLPILRSPAALRGVLLILLGVWGALIPLVGPYFRYAYTPDTAWHFTLARLWLEILPGAAAALGGVLVIVSTRRLPAAGGVLLAILAGGWFVVGRAMNALWPNLGTPGVPAGPASRMALEEIGFFTGLGIVIVFVATLALCRFSVPTWNAGSISPSGHSVPAEDGGQLAQGGGN